ncbi:hypothetical protein QWU01_20435 [Kluyvera cryocrescens]|uniref:Uncharacterized protein n=1 Tax=Kluyvera cryocrescens TaxID=580 RepID=A0AAW9CBH4_KLUCR|nr:MULTISPECIES: hypothetical protein [Enterobacteriaceae]MDW3779177.1 hypothetical protein [Kluyvera cryocrescens]
MKKITFTLMLLISVQASAAVNSWTRTWVQGVTEYRIQSQDGAELLLTCTSEDSVFVQYTAPDGRSISNTDGDSHDIQAQTDSGDMYSIYDTTSDAGGANFEAFWAKARQSHRVHITSAGMPDATFTFSNAAKVLPAFDKSGCLTRI